MYTSNRLDGDARAHGTRSIYRSRNNEEEFITTDTTVLVIGVDHLNQKEVGRAHTRNAN